MRYKWAVMVKGRHVGPWRSVSRHEKLETATRKAYIVPYEGYFEVARIIPLINNRPAERVEYHAKEVR